MHALRLLGVDRRPGHGCIRYSSSGRVYPRGADHRGPGLPTASTRSWSSRTSAPISRTRSRPSSTARPIHPASTARTAVDRRPASGRATSTPTATLDPTPPHRRSARPGPRTQRQPSRERVSPATGRAHALLLLRLPAQHLHQAGRGLARRRRHRLSRHGPADGASSAGRRAYRADPDGRRGRPVDRPGAVRRGLALRAEPRRRRHVPPIWRTPAGRSRRRRRGEHHPARCCYNPVDRRDDRRTATSVGALALGGPELAVRPRA